MISFLRESFSTGDLIARIGFILMSAGILLIISGIFIHELSKR